MFLHYLLLLNATIAVLSAVYYSVNTYHARRYKHRKLSAGLQISDVSVVITVHKESRRMFENAIRAVSLQKARFFVLGDTRYEELTKTYGGTFINFVGRKRDKLNYIMPMINTPYVLFLDSDTIISEGDIGRMRANFTPKVGGVSVNVMFAGTSLVSLCSNFFARIGEVVSRSLSTVTGNGLLLNGVCSMYQTEVVRPLIESEAFRNPKIMGIKSILSDDRQLTNYVIKTGYKAVVDYGINVETKPQKNMYFFSMQLTRWIRGGFLYFLQELSDGTAFKRGGLYTFNSFFMYSLPLILAVSYVASLSHNVMPFYLMELQHILAMQLNRLSGDFLIVNMLRLLGVASTAAFILTLRRMINSKYRNRILLSGIVTIAFLSVFSIYAILTSWKQTEWLTR